MDDFVSTEPSPGEGLNPEQSDAAKHGSGPLLVIAGAGTGKTRTLAARVAHLVSQGVSAERILLLTFTRQASREMLSRVGRQEKRGVWGGTFHAIAHRLLRIYAEPMGLAPGFTVQDRADAEDMIDLERSKLGLKSSPKSGNARFPGKGTCLSIYSRCVNAEETVEKCLLERFPWVSGHEAALRTLFRAYEQRKQASSVLDLDDLLVWWRGLQEDAVLGPDVAARFDHVLVDEYQDTNRLQRAILLALRKDNKNLTVVGDDAQAIYGFRAATVRNILDFEKDFPGARVVRLERNYRSTQPLLEATNAVIALARERHEKTLVAASAREAVRPELIRCRDERAQADRVIRSALERLEQGILLRKQAVLFRAAHHSDLLEVELSRRKIPFRKFGGLRFLEAAHVKDVLAILRIVENPKDETAWFRVLRLIEGIGPKTARRAFERLAADGFALAALERIEVPKVAASAWSALRELVSSLAPAEVTVSTTIERVRVFYEPILARVYDHANARSQDLDALARIGAASASRREFLADVTLDPPSSTSDLAGPPRLDDDWLVLSTIHSAKGLEWDAVTVIHAADGFIPSDLATGRADEIEEERRVFYVALSRARRFLTVMAPLRYHLSDRGVSDRHGYAQLTRFLPESVARHFDRTADAAPDGEDAPASVTAAVADAVRSRAIKRWE